jgi:hypothetical protein
MPRRLDAVRSFAVYYGRGGLDVLSTFDLLILEPLAWQAADLALLKNRGCLLVAYLSALEVPANGDPPAHLLRVNGQSVENRAYKNWILDPRATATRQRFLDKAATLLADGYDGLFIDTLADVEEGYVPADIRDLLVPAAARLVAEVAHGHPDALLLQNRGLNYLFPRTACHLDGVLWEDFPFAHSLLPVVERESWERVAVLRQADRVRVLALNAGLVPERQARARSIAAACGYPWYHADAYTLLPQSQPLAPLADQARPPRLPASPAGRGR